MQTERTAQKRLRSHDWLEVGLEVLASDGPDGLKLEPICQAAGKTRGSFYHHFETHENFIGALMMRWADKNTEMIVAEVESTPKEQDRRGALTRLALSIDFSVERGVRRLAITDKIAAAALADVDARRLEFASGFYQEEFGFNAQDGLAVAEVVYSAYIGQMMVFPDKPDEWRMTFAGWLTVMIDAAAEHAKLVASKR